MMATFAHYVICVLSLLLLPGGWARDEPECCPGQDQYLVYDRETNVTECHIRATNRTIGPPFLPDCETEVKLVLDQPDPSLLAITPRCRDELLEEDGTFVNAFLFCPSSGFGTDPPDLEQGGSKILVRKCCPLEEGYDLRQQECVPRPFSWWLPVLHPETREVRNLSSDNYQLNIDDLSSIPCAKYMLTPKKDPRETYHVLRNTGHLYIQALNSTYSPEEFCLDHGRIDNESWIDLARICHPKEKKILADCKGKVCVQKCCVQTDYLHESGVGPPRCSPAERLWDSKKIFHSHPPAEEVHVITNFPLCPGMTGRGIPLRPTNNPKDKFYLTESGGLMVEKYKMVVDVPRYCVDDIGASSGTLDPIAIVCFPEGSNVKDKAREVIYIIYSVLLVLSATFLLLTFLLYLILPERKSLHGKTLLCYVGCLLVASIALSVAQIGSDNGISNSVCLAAALVTFFFYLSAFFWLNVMSFDIWWNLRCDNNFFS
ncbi:unnamed protein product [Darwinula stevensoni]|uniref:Uncharacterized protein n=1 Tax=Darwinula stevensoni TaxID=69355 RepID=A0A7R8WYA9_9CRUS|nr:unnamed protein product [Darwinula stevensoni]CAG0879164.1 unnamed protein product [Darwinula stevensoni]